MQKLSEGPVPAYHQLCFRLVQLCFQLSVTSSAPTLLGDEAFSRDFGTCHVDMQKEECAIEKLVGG